MFPSSLFLLPLLPFHTLPSSLTYLVSWFMVRFLLLTIETCVWNRWNIKTHPHRSLFLSRLRHNTFWWTKRSSTGGKDPSTSRNTLSRDSRRTRGRRLWLLSRGGGCQWSYERRGRKREARRGFWNVCRRLSTSGSHVDVPSTVKLVNSWSFVIKYPLYHDDWIPSFTLSLFRVPNTLIPKDNSSI